MVKLLVFALALIFISCGGSGKKNGTNDNQADDEVSDFDDVGNDEELVDDEVELFFEIKSVSAPDEYSVLMKIESNFEVEMLENIGYYSISCYEEKLAIESAEVNGSMNLILSSIRY